MIGALDFAERLLARWHVRVLARPPLGLVFRRPERPRAGRAAAVVSHASVHLELRPRIELTLVRSVPGATAREPRGPERVLVLPAADQLVLRAPAAVAAERLLARVVARSTREARILAGGPEREAGQPPPKPPLPARAVDLVVRREWGTAEDRAASAPGAPLITGQSHVGTASTSAGPAQLQQADVSHLADSVIATLDQRLVAYAERAGIA